MSGLAALFWESGRAQVALAVDQAIDGEFRAAAASTVKAVGVGVATGIALGELGAAAVDAGAAVLEKGGDRGGKAFTRGGKLAVKDANRAANGGTTVCENCGTETVPGQRSLRGVSPPLNETNVDHVIPKAHGGKGDPLNGQVLCCACNLEKSDRMP